MSVSGIDDDKGARERTFTEKGLAYQIEQRTACVKKLMSEWHHEAEKMSVVLSDSDDPNVITQNRDKLMNVMKVLRDEYGRLNSLLGADHERTSMDERYESIENEHHKLITSVSDSLREIKSESSERFSRARSKQSSHHSSQKLSVRTTGSRKQELAERAEALKIKLKYLDIESKAKLEYERVKACKDLDITQATLVAQDTYLVNETIEHPIPKLELPTTNKADLVSDYIATHTQEEQLNIKQESDVKVKIEPKTEVSTSSSPFHYEPN